MKKLSLFILFISLFQSSLLSNDAWFEVEIKDPFSNDTIKAYDVKSFNSSVYNSPSKYDGIFWPFIDEKFLVYNPKNGYINFYPEFQTISKDKKSKVEKYLKAHFKPSSNVLSHLEKIVWWGKVHQIDSESLEKQIAHYCLLAYLSRFDETLNASYQKKSLALILKQLPTLKPSFIKARLYLVCGHYYQALNDKLNSEKYFELATNSDLGKESRNNIRKYRNYLEGTIADLKSGKYKEDYLKKL